MGTGTAAESAVASAAVGGTAVESVWTGGLENDRGGVVVVGVAGEVAQTAGSVGLVWGRVTPRTAGSVVGMGEVGLGGAAGVVTEQLSGVSGGLAF